LDTEVNAGIWLWIAFNAGIITLLLIDLGIFHKEAHAVSVKEAALWTVTWVSLAMIFNAGVYFLAGHEPGVAFLTGYVIELSLSVDNIFVFVLIFAYFAVPAAYQHRVLFWGILSVIVMRGAFIIAGSVLVEQLHWVLYAFGVLLIISAYRMATSGAGHEDPSSNPAVRFIRRFFPVTENYEAHRFFVRRESVFMVTPLFIVLVALNTTDLVFAIDSIPAIFAITHDPFIVYTSNLCAVMGLRSMYFLLAGVVDRFHYLQIGLSVVLAFVGTKMLIEDIFHVPVEASLGVIASVITLAVVASLIFPKEPELEHVAEQLGSD
jgi:tellurite resistance protein TerC